MMFLLVIVDVEGRFAILNSIISAEEKKDLSLILSSRVDKL